MLTYALFIATEPEPVSSSDWSHLDEVFDRARLSSGGTKVEVRATEGTGQAPEDFDVDIATFINGIHLEVRDDGVETFTYLADGKPVGTVQLDADRWLLMRAPAVVVADGEPVAVVSATEHTREEAEQRLGKVVEDWLA